MATASKLPSVFVGSSVEGLPVAEAIQVALDYVCEVTIWSQGVFGLGEGTLESLVKRIDDFDFAVLVLTADDLVESRGATHQSPRDNVLLELGLFIGSLGTRRTFAVFDRTSNIRLPSDLAGVTLANYRPHSAGNLEASLGAACTKIKRSIEAQGLREDRPLEIASEIEGTKKQAVTSVSESRRREIINEIRRFLDSLSELYEEAAAAGKESLSESFSDKRLRTWKYDVLKFLDANFHTDETAPFADLHSCEGGATPLRHLLSSYEEHRNFLEALSEEIKAGRGELKASPHPSGNRLPRFGTFVYRN